MKDTREGQEILLQEAHSIAEAYAGKMVPKVLKEIENYFHKDNGTFTRESWEPVIGKWLSMTYALGYMDAVQKKQLKKFYV